MAQDGLRHHQDATSSEEHSFVPPTTTTILGPAENDNGGSRIGSPVDMDANKGKDDVITNAIQGGEHGSDSDGKANASRSEGKNAAASVASADAAGDGLAKSKNSLAADDDGELKVQIITERERRRRMKELFGTLRELMPHVPEKADKVTLVEETIDFIRSLEKTKAQLEKQRQQQVLACQAATEAGASSLLVRTAHGMAALSDGWGPAPQQAPAASAPPLLAADPGQVEFQTWSTPNVVLSVLTNDEAVINVCAPRQSCMLTMVVSVLKKHGIDVVSMQVAADSVRSLFTVYTRVNGAGGENPSANDIYKLAVSEIMVWLSS